MPSVEETAYPRLKSNLSKQALETLYSPAAEEILLAQQRTRGEIAFLGFLVLLKTFQTVGELALFRRKATCAFFLAN